MRIASFNVNGVNGRLPVLLRWLEETTPDIVCLQELKSPDERFPEAAIAALGYDAVWYGQPRWNGVAILSRVGAIHETRRGLPGTDDGQSRYLEAAVAGILIGCLYLPNGNPRPGPKFDYKLAWIDRLLAHARELIAADVPAVLAGDFNIIPTPADVYKPERWTEDALYVEPVRAAFAALEKQGWKDALRSLHPGATIYTFWDYFRQAYQRDAGLRIDHLMLAPKLAKRLKAAGVDRDVRGWTKASDHAPVWIELKGGRAK
ncbi:exodeoxyribonuclease III [Allosphingosinicella indica]|uniref:Exodeoxyribonuclease III n=1 Tax=Allosphingosinicella indica TaxID=941907 RepID=A0A1X7G7I6_9SPHN|nr:exodeoxyribonuclease III [Allosphingosinicella indica]SMF65324.1 Exodeoxyribonuclease III [Allosphingosinicella indica]